MMVAAWNERNLRLPPLGRSRFSPVGVDLSGASGGGLRPDSEVDGFSRIAVLPSRFQCPHPVTLAVPKGIADPSLRATSKLRRPSSQTTELSTATGDTARIDDRTCLHVLSSFKWGWGGMKVTSGLTGRPPGRRSAARTVWSASPEASGWLRTAPQGRPRCSPWPGMHWYP